MSRSNPTGYAVPDDDDGGDVNLFSMVAMLDAPVPMHSSATDTEAAAARIMPIVGTLRWQTLEWVKEAGDVGLTAAEGGALYAAQRDKPATDASCRYSIAPRLTELSKAGLIRDSGIRRGGGIAWVFVAGGENE